MKAQREDQTSFFLTPIEKDIFEFKKADIKIEFKIKEKKLILEKYGKNMKCTKIKYLNIFLIISILCSHFTFGQNKTITQEKKEKVKKYIKYFEDKNQMMGTVSIFENGKEVINTTFWEKNIEQNITTRKYAIGAITKMFTAILLAKLQEEGKISFDEKLSNYFTNVPNAHKIKIKNMLNHSSGLKDYIYKNGTDPYWLIEPQTKTDIMNEIIKQGVAFEPEEKIKYSNSAYYLLGRILEKTYDKPYSQIIKNEITIPLGLKNTLAMDKNSNPINFAASYEKRNNNWNKMEEFYLPNLPSAGNIISTAQDLNLFLNALFNYKIIKKQTLQSMLPKKGKTFGMGILKLPFNNHIDFGHTGGTFGTHSLTAYNPKNNLAITYIINGENYPNNDFPIGLLDIIYYNKYKVPEFKIYTPEKVYFKFYEGTYKAKNLPIPFTIFQKKRVFESTRRRTNVIPFNTSRKTYF